MCPCITWIETSSVCLFSNTRHVPTRNSHQSGSFWPLLFENGMGDIWRCCRYSDICIRRPNAAFPLVDERFGPVHHFTSVARCTYPQRYGAISQDSGRSSSRMRKTATWSSGRRTAQIPATLPAPEKCHFRIGESFKKPWRSLTCEYHRDSLAFMLVHNSMIIIILSCRSL